MRNTHESRMVCTGCGAEATTPYAFRCPRAGGHTVDHVLSRHLDVHWVRFPSGDEPNPFIRYRTLLRSYHVARAYGMSDDGFVALVRAFDESVARVDGHGFAVTPFCRDARLSERLGFARDGGVWVKDETGNVSGSHKGRHLAGIMLYLQVLEQVGLATRPLPPLAIASCGNAALAAAVVARAAGRELHVFIPPDAPSSVVERLHALDAKVTECPRVAGVTGDPCYHAFREAVAHGALPFCCQGNENGLTIEGGETLAYEMVSQLAGDTLDRVIVQVGGGALASAVIQGFNEAHQLGAIRRLPCVHTVQTMGAYPLKRAYDLLVPRAALSVPEAIRYAATHRDEFMWPWEQAPHSLAHGILDDETYDWLAVVSGMLESGGSPLVVTEDGLKTAYEAARTADSGERGAESGQRRAERGERRADPTGTAGLAGLMQLQHLGLIRPAERVGIIYSGAER